MESGSRASRHRPFVEERRARALLHLLLAPRVVFVLALVSLWASGRWRPLGQQLLDPGALLAGLAAGGVLYAGSLMLVQRRRIGWKAWMAALKRSLESGRPTALRTTELVFRALYEEVFWRGVIQHLLGNSPPAIAGTAVMFTLRHVYLSQHGGRSLRRRLWVEFLVFSLVLGVVYAVFDQILLVVGLHAARNLLLEIECRPQPR